MFKRLTILLALLLTALLPATADTAEKAHCGALSDADCQILTDNYARMEALGAFHFEQQADISVALNGEDRISVAIAGSGDLAMDASAADEGDDIAEQAEAVISSLAGQMQFVITETIDGIDKDTNISLMMREGVLLIDASAMGELMGDDLGGMEWFGIDLNGSMELLLEQAGVDYDMDESADELPADAMTVTRLADETIDGVDVAVFATAIDLWAAMDEADLAEAQAMLGMGGELRIDDVLARMYIGVDDGYTRRVELSAAVAMTDDTGSLDMTLSASVDLSAFDEPIAVMMPDDVPAFPLAMLLAMSNQ